MAGLDKTIYTISPDVSICETLNIINKNKFKILFVCDVDAHLIGTITDGDIRRYLINAGNINDSISSLLNRNPFVVYNHSEIEESDWDKYKAIPIVDDNNKILELCAMEKDEKSFDFALLMAGGEGKRLRPLTNDIPKPMLPVHNKPLLEHQILKLINYNIKKVYISVNYLSDYIIDYFGDGSRFGIQIEYLKEDKKLGTAGCLSLLDVPEKGDFILLNGDVVTDLNISKFYHFHKTNESALTICGKDYSVKMPYGIIEHRSDNVICTIVEKPTYTYFCNSGIYALNTSITKGIENEYLDMPDFINQVKLESKVYIYKMYEYWNDIGQIDDYNRECNR